MKKRLLLATIAVMSLLVCPVAAWAHPVVTITFWLKFKLDSTGLVGMDETWEFDQTHSKQILTMFDSNHDGTIGPTELPALKRGYFDHLEKFSYFNTVVLDGHPATLGTATDFSATYRDHRMYYHMFLPLQVKASDRLQEVDVTIWDPTYFTDLEPHGSSAISVEKSDGIAATVYSANDHRHFYNLAPGVTLIKKPPFYLPMHVLKFKLE